MTLAMFDPWITWAKEWQPLLAGVLAILASIIVAAGLVVAAKVRAAGANPKLSEKSDLRVMATPGWNDTETFDTVSGNLEKLRSLLRSALSSLSSPDANQESARLLCTRIAAFQWKHFPIPANADKNTRETYGLLLNQFEMLRVVLGNEWSPSQASAILIQLNASARALSATLKQAEAGEPQAPWRKNHNL